jgi:hypothetical protein
MSKLYNEYLAPKLDKACRRKGTWLQKSKRI